MTQENEWCWIGVPFEMSFCTYNTYKYKEHPIEDKYKSITSLSELKQNLENNTINIDSPTACYFDIDLVTGIFYRDQQDCVIWVFEKDTGFIKTTEGQYVAKSLREFLSHVDNDCRKWYKLSKSGMPYSAEYKRMFGY